MASAHINFNESLKHGFLLRSAMRGLEDGLEHLNDVFACMEQMKDGDGSQAEHFSVCTTRFGFDSDAKAKEAFEELASVRGKLTTNAEVEFVHDAMIQAFNKLR